MDGERKPMLSHDAMVNLCEEGQLYPWQTEARKVRDFYEHLIAIGKLRVVEEADYDCDDKELRRIIQVLVNDMATLRRLFAIAVGQDVHVIGDSMDDAKRIGITPSNTP